MAGMISTVIYLYMLVMLFVAFVYCNPIKTSKTQKATNECNRLNCLVELDALAKTIKNVKFTEKSTDVIPSVLPNNKDTLSKTASMLENVTTALQTHDQRLQNMTSRIAIFFENVATLLENQLLVLNKKLPSLAAKDCQDIGANVSGAYRIAPKDDLGSFIVHCDMDNDGGGWTVFQRRFDGSVNFYRRWDEYVQGFGSPDGEYWAGLWQIYRLTKDGNFILRIDLEDFDGNTAYAEYESFSVGDTVSHYQLSIGAYSGNAGNSLAYHRNRAFTTKDRDYDTCRSSCSHHDGNCAKKYHGAWWYKSCHRSNLNGRYLGPSGNSHSAMVWQHWKGFQSLKRSEMKLRHV